MKSKDIINALTINLLSNENLIITIVQLFTAHDAHFFKELRFLDKVSETDGGDVGAAEIKILHKRKVRGNRPQRLIFDLGAAKKVEPLQKSELTQLGNASV